MANKAISELPQALNVNNQDLFVLEQSGIAKKLTAETFITEQGIIDALAEALDGHGGIQSVTLSSVSGRIRTYLITFTDETTTTFQVLDGTSIDRIVKTSTAGLTDTYTVFMTDGTTTFFTVTNGADGTVSEAMLNDALKDKAPAITETTESSAIATFPDGADDMVMHHVVAEINPVQDLSNGDPSPTNICPITGHTEVNVTRTGANVVSSEFELGSLSNTTGAPASSSSYKRTKDYISIKPNTKYYIKASSGVFIKCYDSDYNAVYTNWDVNNLYNVEFTTRSNATYMKIVIPVAMDVSSFSINYPATATAYEPYQSETVTVDWTSEAGTVYGGTIDVVSGKLVVDRAYGTLDGSESWGGNFAEWYMDKHDMLRMEDYTNMIKCDTLQTVARASVSQAGFHITGYGASSSYIGQNWIYVRLDPSITTASQVQAWFREHPTHYVYPLATPQTYQLTPQQLMTLLGTNNVWADTGNVSVTYPADTKMFIEKLTMPTEDDLVANQAITSGKYFMIGNSLYLALANIASGAAITIGTNAQRVSLADALNTINS